MALETRHRVGKRTLLSVVLFMASLFVSLFVFGTGPSSAQEGHTIGGLIADDNGPVSGVQVDLFAGDGSGARLEWLRSTTTGSGTYSFDVAPGCYVVTLVAPQSRVFDTGSRWVNGSVCARSGTATETVNGRLSGTTGEGTIWGGVRGGASYVEAIIDVFKVTGDGSRGEWVRAERATAAGMEFTLPAGCYVLTAIAPGDDVFEATGTAWENRPVCVADGERFSMEFVIRATASSRLQALVVDPDFASVPGVPVDLFTSDPEGTRLNWLRSAVTDGDGIAAFDVAAGCYVMTAIAPAGQTFELTNTRWFNGHDCVAAGGFVYDPRWMVLASGSNRPQ